MQKLFIDIETLPADESCLNVLRAIHEKKCQKRRVYQSFEQFFLSTSFDGSFGRILCVSYASNDQEPQTLYEDGDETAILARFWEIAYEHELFVGHNVMDFDLRFIYQRSVINRVKPSKELSFARYKNYPIFDTMREWSKWSSDNVGLEHLALALGIPTPKDGIAGSQVFEFYKKGRISEILKYCQRDVEAAREVYKRMTFCDVL